LANDLNPYLKRDLSDFLYLLLIINNYGLYTGYSYEVLVFIGTVNA